MIQILPCPACNRETVLPESASWEASIRCPHCREQFRLGDLLRQQYGVWEITYDPQAIAARQGGQAGSTDAHEPELVLAPLEPGARHEASAASGAASDATSREASGDAKKADWSNFKPLTHEDYERMKRKSRSPLWSLLQIVLGGVAAVPIALLILWHGLGRDVLDAGPRVARVLPWIVPAQFHPPQPPAAAREPLRPRSGSNGFRDFDHELGGEENDVAGEHATDRGVVGRENSDQSDESGSAAGSTVPSASDPAVPSVPAIDAPTEPDQPSFPLQAADEADAQNVFAAIRRCEQLLIKWSQGGDSTADRRAAAQLVYSELVSLALLIDKLPSGNPVLRIIRDQMKSIGSSIKGRSDVQDLIREGAAYTLANLHPESQRAYGLALTLENELVTASDDAWLITPTESSAPPAPEGMQITFRIPKYLTPQLIAQQRLFLLGTIRQLASADDGEPAEYVFEASYLYSFGH